MLGAIIGDIVGSPYERKENNIYTKKFPLFSEASHFTDDTVMTVAVFYAFRRYLRGETDFKDALIRSFKYYGRLYPGAGFGRYFYNWIMSEDINPYNSFGNGSAMRVSSIPWLVGSLEDAEKFAEISAKVTHNHKEGIRGAQTIAGAIYILRKYKNKTYVKQYVTNKCYDTDTTVSRYRDLNVWDSSCKVTVPVAIRCFLESTGFEDCLRTAVSAGGDSDTICAMAGSMAEAYYGIGAKLKTDALAYLDKRILNEYKEFERMRGSQAF